MNYTAIIFDMDGTIIDTEHVWQKANKMLIERRGIAYTDTVHATLAQRLGGLAIHHSCAIIKEVMCLDEPLDMLINEKRALARSLYKEGIQFIDGFSDFHAQAVACGLSVAVATNADEHIVQVANEALRLDRFFGNHIYSISSIGNIGKPSPAIYLHTANKLGTAVGDCIAIEDSAHGIAAAKAAGMYCIGINTAKKREALAAADVIIEKYSDINLQKMIQ